LRTETINPENAEMVVGVACLQTNDLLDILNKAAKSHQHRQSLSQSSILAGMEMAKAVRIASEPTSTVNLREATPQGMNLFMFASMVRGC